MREGSVLSSNSRGGVDAALYLRKYKGSHAHPTGQIIYKQGGVACRFPHYNYRNSLNFRLVNFRAKIISSENIKRT